jgi:hypothetical protein
VRERPYLNILDFLMSQLRVVAIVALLRDRAPTTAVLPQTPDPAAASQHGRVNRAVAADFLFLALCVLGGPLGGDDVFVAEDEQGRVLLVVMVDVFQGAAGCFGVEAGGRKVFWVST